jgi:cytidylate kinase
VLAEAVAQKLGYRCIDRDQIIQRAAAWGVSQDDLRTALEKPPSFFGQSPQTKYIYLAFIQAALAEAVQNGNAIYHGLAGHLLLGKGPHVLRTRLIAPMEFRIGKLQSRCNCTRKDSIAYIRNVDEERRKWTRFLYDVEWADASLYDLVLNLEQMDIPQACELICSASQLKCFEFTAETQRIMDDLVLSSRVKASLAMDPATAAFQFEVVADSGHVSVKGGVISPDQSNRIREIVCRVPGVIEAELRDLQLFAHV